MTEIHERFSKTICGLKVGFPNMLLTEQLNLSHRWMSNFISTYLNRDLLQRGLNASPNVIRSLWTMMAHLNGQLLPATAIGNSLGVTTPTVKRYIDFLEAAFLKKFATISLEHFKTIGQNTESISNRYRSFAPFTGEYQILLPCPAILQLEAHGKHSC